MNSTQIDRRSLGVGKFVLIMLPDTDTYNHDDISVVVERTKKLSGELTEMLGIPVGYMGGSVSFLEFLWSQELDTEKVNQALNKFLETHPDLTIKFQGKSEFPPMGF